jgi:hypothetical protein
MKPHNIIFVKHGDKYSAEHVNVLHKQLLVYYPAANYYCYTDDPVGVSIPIIPIFKKPSLRKWWNKLALFSEAMPFKGKCLYFDLDMDVISDPRSFIQKFDGLTILEDYWKIGNIKYDIPHAYDVTINSSVITWTAGEQTHIWKHFLTNQDYFMRKYKGIDRFIVHENIPHKTFDDGLVNSIANEPNKIAPINMYNGIDYELQNRNI